MALEKLKRHKSPSIDQIPEELIKAVGRTIRFETHNLINSVWNKEELPEQWKLLFIVPIYKKCDKRDPVIVEAYYFCQQHAVFYPTFCCQD